MGKLSSRFFTQQEKEAVETAIRAVEEKTAGEVVVLVADASDEYREATVAGGMIMAAFIAFIASVVLHHETIWFYVPALFITFFPSLFVTQALPRIRLALVPRARTEVAVRERAIRSFYEKGLHRTRDESGVLIFISIIERKVWILGDRGINARINPEGWKVYASRIAAGIREGQTAVILCEVIRDCGKILAEAFPPREGDLNELPDHVIT